jgi:octaprenyl-diphosphate synthase
MNFTDPVRSTPASIPGNGFDVLSRALSAQSQALKAFLDEQIKAFEPPIQPLVHYCLAHPGKRLRPMLLFASVTEAQRKACGPDLLRAAAVLELIHLATLVHDDIIDQATLRHHMPSVPQQWGPKVAVLLGDALFAHALVLASQFADPCVCRWTAQATRLLCCGEIQQTLSHEADRIPTINDYLACIQAKTATLFELSCKLAHYLRGDKPEQRASLEGFGKHLGIAYQLFDDALDVFGHESEVGKTLGTDFKTYKYTLPVLLLMEALPGAERAKLLQGMLQGTVTPQACTDLMRQAGVMPKVLYYFIHHIDQARAFLEDLDEVNKMLLSGLLDAVEIRMRSCLDSF